MYRIGFFILLVVNIALVVIFTFRPRPTDPKQGMQEQIVDALTLTSEQQEQFDEMVMKHRVAIHSLEEQERALVSSYFSQLTSEKTADNDQAKILRDIIQLEKDKILVTYNHFEELKAICDNEQLEKFDEVIRRVVPMLTNTSNRPRDPAKPLF